MEAREGRETAAVMRGLLLLRLGLIAPLIVVVTLHTCVPAVTTSLILLLLAMGGLPFLAHLLQSKLPSYQRIHLGIALFDFLATAVANILALVYQGTPLLFPLFYILALEAACWWGWTGAVLSGAMGGAILSMLYSQTWGESRYGLALVALTVGWSVFLGRVSQWALEQWHGRRQVAGQVAKQEDALRHVEGLLFSWSKVCLDLHQESSPEALLQTALRCAVEGTASNMGLVTLGEEANGGLRAECWEGFALPGPDKVTLLPRDRLPSLNGGDPLEVRHVLQAPLAAIADAGPGQEFSARGQIVVARHRELSYGEAEKRWLNLLAGYTAVLLENHSLQGKLGQIQEETDSVLLASRTLASLPDLASALEMACRDILKTLNLLKVSLHLFREGQEQGYRRIIYPVDEPTHTVMSSLQGRGLRLLRSFLDSGSPLVVNRRSEYPELFDAMGWGEEVQGVACFPLHVRHHRWGILCMQARTPGAFPPQTQQNLSIFCGEVAMALENFYLRQVLTKAGA